MIRLLKGTVLWRNNTHILVDVRDVGYYVYASADVHSRIQSTGDVITVFTYMHVREDLLELYGFISQEDLFLFEQFLTVSGIGPKTAMGIFTIGNRGKIVQAILSGDVHFFSAVPRLGKKNAQKLIIELKGKIGALEDTSMPGDSQGHNEVVDALKTFGFSTREIGDALRSIGETNVSVSEKVKLALRHLGR